MYTYARSYICIYIYIYTPLLEGVSSDHRIVTAKVRLSLRKNATRKATTKHYDWALLNNRDIRDKYALELRNRFEALQEMAEISTPNDEYENFVEAHLEAAAKCIPTKPRTKYRAPWEKLAVREKPCTCEDCLQKLSKEPNKHNARELEKAQHQLTGIYLKEQAEYIQIQIDKIRDSVEDRQSRIAWQTLNESKWKEEHSQSKIESCKPTRKSKTVGTAFQKSTRKPTGNNR